QPLLGKGGVPSLVSSAEDIALLSSLFPHLTPRGGTIRLATLLLSCLVAHLEHGGDGLLHWGCPSLGPGHCEHRLVQLRTSGTDDMVIVGAVDRRQWRVDGLAHSLCSPQESCGSLWVLLHPIHSRQAFQTLSYTQLLSQFL